MSLDQNSCSTERKGRRGGGPAVAPSLALKYCIGLLATQPVCALSTHRTVLVAVLQHGRLLWEVVRIWKTLAALNEEHLGC